MLDLFETRAGFLAARGVDISRIKFATAFGRGLDYYSGVVFELHDPAVSDRHLVAGGRYDGLLSRLGSAEPIPAVGFAAWIDRLAGRRRGRMSAPFVIAVPSKGRLQQNAQDFFARAGLTLTQPRGAREYRGDDRRPRRASKSPISRPPTSPGNWRKARPISASPAKTSCAR